MGIQIRVTKDNSTGTIDHIAIIYANRAHTIGLQHVRALCASARQQNSYELWDTTRKDSATWWVGRMLATAGVPFGSTTAADREKLKDIVDEFLSVLWEDEVAEELCVKYWNR